LRALSRRLYSGAAAPKPTPKSKDGSARETNCLFGGFMFFFCCFFVAMFAVVLATYRFDLLVLGEGRSCSLKHILCFRTL
jgi:hypothetical protein